MVTKLMTVNVLVSLLYAAVSVILLVVFLWLALELGNAAFRRFCPATQLDISKLTLNNQDNAELTELFRARWNH
jgi:hypothetical protein